MSAPTRPPSSSDIMLEALGQIQVQSERHRQAIDELRKFTHRPPAQADRELLTAADPVRGIDLGTEGVASVGLLNLSTVTVYLGIAGRSAAQGNGLPIAPLSYIVLPLRTNLIDVGIDPATAPAGGADVIVLRYDTAQPFEGGPLGTANPSGGVGDVVDVSDRAGRLLGVAVVSSAAGSTWDVSDRAARVLGAATTTETRPGNAAHTNVAAANADTVLFAANAAARARTIFNDSASANLFVKFGAGASAASFVVKIPPGGYYELPQPLYTGAVNGFWDAAVGNARLCETS